MTESIELGNLSIDKKRKNPSSVSKLKDVPKIGTINSVVGKAKSCKF